MEYYEKNGNAIYVLNILKKYSDENHILSAKSIAESVEKEYEVKIDPRTVRRIINLLKDKLNYDISTWEENKKGYYIIRDPETDFEPGEIRAIIDTFSYSNYIVPKIASNIIEKCKKMQNIYENERIKDYKIYSRKGKTENMEVIKNIEDIVEAIYRKRKIYFEYWKYEIADKLKKNIVSTPKVSPYAIVYDKQEFYLIGIKDKETKFYYYRLDRIKNLEILDVGITIKKTDKQIKEFVDSTVEMFGGKIEEIEAICNKKLLDEVLDRFGKNITIEKIDKDENNFKLILDTSTLGFKMWAMRNIDFVEVKRPKSLRDEIKEIILSAQKKYK